MPNIKKHTKIEKYYFQISPNFDEKPKRETELLNEVLTLKLKLEKHVIFYNATFTLT